MGKNSLIKSTSKKKSQTKKEETETKKQPAKKAVAKASKPAKPKTKAPAKKAKAAAPARKAKASPAAKPAATKKVSLKDLIFKKFDSQQPPKAAPKKEPKAALRQAPPIIASTDPQETARLRNLLFKHFSMEDIKATAKAAPVKPAASPKAAAEPEAPPKPAAAPKPAAESRPPETAKAPEAVKKPAAPKPSPAPEKEVKVEVLSDTPMPSSGPDPVQKALKYGIAGFALLLLLIIGASYQNSAKYYLQSKDDAIEIWHGRFSPQGKALFFVLHGKQLAESPQADYTRKDVYSMIFNYYMEKADALLDVSGLPNYEGIRDYLHKAQKYVISAQMGKAVKSRLANIQRMTLLYKADVALSKGTAEALDGAEQYLKEASRLTTDAAQAELIKQKMAAVQQQKTALAAEGGETPAAPSAPAEAGQQTK